MIIYRYHPTTKEFLSRRIVSVPEEPLQNETAIAPPECDGVHTPVFNSGQWVVTPDYRRIIFYKKTTRAPVRLPLGETPDETLTRLKPTDPLQTWNESSQKWDYSLEVVKSKKISELFRQCDAKLREALSIYPETEPETWSEKIKQSELWLLQSDEGRLAIISNPTQAMLFLTLLTEATGKLNLTADDIPTVTSLATRIVRNKTAFGAYAGLVLKIKTETAVAITSAQTINQVYEIPIDFTSISLVAIVTALGGG